MIPRIEVTKMTQQPLTSNFRSRLAWWVCHRSAAVRRSWKTGLWARWLEQRWNRNSDLWRVWLTSQNYSGKIVAKDKTHAWCCKGTPNHWIFCSNKNIHITVITPLKGISKIASWWLRSRTLPKVLVFNITVSTATCLLAKNAILLSKLYPPGD